jgi:hypothetical protein
LRDGAPLGILAAGTLFTAAESRILHVIQPQKQAGREMKRIATLVLALAVSALGFGQTSSTTTTTSNPATGTTTTTKKTTTHHHHKKGTAAAHHKHTTKKTTKTTTTTSSSSSTTTPK